MPNVGCWAGCNYSSITGFALWTQVTSQQISAVAGGGGLGREGHRVGTGMWCVGDGMPWREFQKGAGQRCRPAGRTAHGI